MNPELPAESEMQALVGHRFPGGEYRIEHWENFLYSDATGVAPLPDGLAHPAHLFHVAINGVGTSISELFGLAGCSAGAPVSIDYYDWRIHAPFARGRGLHLVRRHHGLRARGAAQWAHA